MILKEVQIIQYLKIIQKLAIDHYLPWSLVTHDKLWNLHPIEQYANSSKSNKIADDKYLCNYTNLQYKFMHHISSLNPKYLEDYFNLFSISRSELLNIPKQKFSELLSSKIKVENASIFPCALEPSVPAVEQSVPPSLAPL